MNDQEKWILCVSVAHLVDAKRYFCTVAIASRRGDRGVGVEERSPGEKFEGGKYDKNRQKDAPLGSKER